MTTAVVFCPDCGKAIPGDEFIAHREQEHPPAPRSVATQGIESQEAHGYQPEKE